MFCPKCGTKNPEDGKFCRSCGIDIGGVAKALTPPSEKSMISEFEREMNSAFSFACEDEPDSGRRKDPSEVYGDGVKAVITGVGFLMVSMALLFTGVAGGKTWWWAMLFPAFFSFAKGVSDILKSGKMDRPQLIDPQSMNNLFNRSAETSALPPSTTTYVDPESKYRTGDLVPQSVTDPTTRQLEMNSEGETMTLPKK